MSDARRFSGTLSSSSLPQFPLCEPMSNCSRPCEPREHPRTARVPVGTEGEASVSPVPPAGHVLCNLWFLQLQGQLCVSGTHVLKPCSRGAPDALCKSTSWLSRCCQWLLLITAAYFLKSSAQTSSGQCVLVHCMESGRERGSSQVQTAVSTVRRLWAS